ncbi:DUF6350 family protein [Streptomyces sp. NPDC058274]|uniref:cell division protein PerM n=1 Tax=Streptomyces sp. NPDC058274 TaxID=3346416 RepID=UPI0036E27BB8
MLGKSGVPSVPPQPSAALPVAPPVNPPPPAYAPVPARPSAVGAFVGRTFTGDWAGAVQAALWPVGLLLISAVALAIPSYGQGDDVVVGFGDRMRIALALLLQAFGGGLEVKEASGPGFGGGGGGFASDLSGGGELSLIPLTVTALWIAALFIGVRMLRTRLALRAPRAASAGLEAAVRVVLLVTAAVLVLGLFAQPTVAGLVTVSSSPWLAALGALLLGLAVAGGVLHRDDLAQWLAARPGARTCVRATGTALRALAVVLALCSVVAFVCLAQVDDLGELSDLDGSDVSPLLAALLVLPNLALLALGLSWGAPVEVAAGGNSPFGGGYESRGFGLPELGDAVNSWAVVGALALGLVCALTLGVLAARRSADRREQLLAAGIFFGLFLLLAGIGGFSMQVAGGTSDYGSGYGSDYGSDYGSGSGLGSGFGSGSGSGDAVAGTVSAGVSVTNALLFGALWVFVAALLAPYLLRMAGVRTGAVAPPVPSAPPMPGAPAGYVPGPPQPAPAAPAVPPAPSAPSVSQPAVPPAPGVPAPPGPPVATPPPPAPAPVAYDPHTVQLGHGTPVAAPAFFPPAAPTGPVAPAGAAPHSRAVVWVVTLVLAVVVGGGAAAGVLVWQDHQSKGTSGKAGARPGPTPSQNGASPTPSEAPTPTPTPTPTPSEQPSDHAPAGQLPDGYHRLTDPMGFSVAVPDVWGREGVKYGTQVTYAGSTGLEHLQVGVIANAGYTSYDNFVTLEKTAKKKDTDYRRIRLERNTFQGRAGALWEYTYTDESGRTVHAKDQGYVAESGTEYAIMLVGRDELWESNLAETFRVALDTWERG